MKLYSERTIDALRLADAPPSIEDAPPPMIRALLKLIKWQIRPWWLSCKNITKAQLQNIKRLDLSSNDLTELSSKDLADLTNLEYLDLLDNDLTFLPEGFLSPCPPTLKIINLNLNDLRVLPEGFLSGCTSLREVHLESNYNLEYLPEGFLSGCTSLREVHLRDNNLKYLPKEFLYPCPPNLEYVDLLYNNDSLSVSKEFLSDCTALKRHNRLVVYPNVTGGGFQN